MCTLCLLDVPAELLPEELEIKQSLYHFGWQELKNGVKLSLTRRRAQVTKKKRFFDKIGFADGFISVV